MLTAAAFIIIVAGMREAQPLLVPFLLSGFIAIIAAPALFFLKRHRIPTAAALLLVIPHHCRRRHAVGSAGGKLGG